MNIDFLDDYDDDLNVEEELEDKIDCLIADKDFDKAIKVLEIAEQQSPWKVSIKKELAKVHLIAEDCMSALKIIENIKSQLPVDFEIPAMLSIISRIYGEDSLFADKCEQEAVQLAYYKEDVYFLICYILCASGFFTEAYKYVKKALKYNKECKAIWDHRAFLEYELGKYYAMEKCLQKELSMDSVLAHDYNFHIYSGLMLSYYYSGRFGKVFELLQKCSVEYFKDDCSLVVASQICRLYGDDNKSNGILQYVFANKKDEFENLKETIVLGKIAHTIIDIKGETESFNFLGTYIRQLADSKNPAIRKGIKLLFKEDYDVAIEVLKECISNDSSAVLRVAIACGLFYLGRVNEVINWLDEAMKLSKDKYTCWFYFSFITESQEIISYINDVWDLWYCGENPYFNEDRYIKDELFTNINIYLKQIFSKKVIKKTMDCYKFLIANDFINKHIYKEKMDLYMQVTESIKNIK